MTKYSTTPCKHPRSCTRYQVPDCCEDQGERPEEPPTPSSIADIFLGMLSAESNKDIIV